jgi:hypothetical protein
MLAGGNDGPGVHAFISGDVTPRALLMLAFRVGVPHICRIRETARGASGGFETGSAFKDWVHSSRKERIMPTDKTPRPPDQPKHLENLFAPEWFATEASSFEIHSGVVSITFTSKRYDNSVVPAALNKVVVGRIVMPPHGAKSLAVELYNFLAKNGMEPIQLPKNPTEVQ